MKEIGETIREIRESKKISQYAMAYAIDISQAAYSKIERGETELKTRHLYLIAGVLKISIYELLPPSLASSSIGNNDYLLKPILIKLQSLWFAYRARKKLLKLPKEKRYEN